MRGWVNLPLWGIRKRIARMLDRSLDLLVWNAFATLCQSMWWVSLTLWHCGKLKQKSLTAQNFVPKLEPIKHTSPLPMVLNFNGVTAVILFNLISALYWYDTFEKLNLIRRFFQKLLQFITLTLWHSKNGIEKNKTQLYTQIPHYEAHPPSYFFLLWLVIISMRPIFAIILHRL